MRSSGMVAPPWRTAAAPYRRSQEGLFTLARIEWRSVVFVLRRGGAARSRPNRLNVKACVFTRVSAQSCGTVVHNLSTKNSRKSLICDPAVFAVGHRCGQPPSGYRFLPERRWMLFAFREASTPACTGIAALRRGRPEGL